MTNRCARAIAVLAAVALAGAAAGGASPIFWHVSTQADFLKGEVESLSIDSHGRLVLGPATEVAYESTAPFLWSLIADHDGNLFAGSGNEGKVFRVGADGSGSVFYDAPELEAHALVLAPGGGLYVGTSPDGRVYKVDARGNATPFFDPEDKYIWALAVDNAGQVYVATGEKGVVYKVAPDGKGSVFYRTKTTHALVLAFDRAGNLLAGTESPGKLFRIDRDGKPFVLLDSSYKEIRAVRVDPRGVIYVAAVNGRTQAEERPAERPSIESPRPPVPSVSTEITSISIVDVSVPSVGQAGAASREDRRAPKGAIYRISPDGSWDLIWESREDSPYDLEVDANGALLVGTGSKGKIYRLEGDPLQATLLARAGAQQVTAFLRDAKGRQFFATANPGKVFRLSGDRAERGTYESDVRDAETVAAWGTISWRANIANRSQIEISTRSGNTETPDDTWSSWSGPYTRTDGDQIASPKARYLQWRAVLSGREGNPALTSVTAAYLQRNLRPEVASITVHPPGIVFQRPFSTGELEIAGYQDQSEDRRPPTPSPSASAQSSSSGPALGRRIYQKGLQTFVWKADDDNEDNLLYDVLYRREGDTNWKTLKKSLTDPIFVWDTTSVPNGSYLIKIVASDSSSNPPGSALAGERESGSFDIDNTPPAIEVTALRRDSGRTILQFDVRDEHSPVQRVEYSVEADRWRAIYPKDGIADSRGEQFELVLEGEAAARAVIIRASDSMNNVATARGEMPAGRGR